MQYISKYSSPMGNMTIASNGNALIGLWFDEQKYFAATLSNEHKEKELPIFQQTKEWLDCYFNGENPGTIPATYLNGSSFRLVVWEILKEIPYGQIITYGDIAKKIVQRTGIVRMSAQAVGGAVGHNPISIIIPCHRVVGSNGSLTGYAGGILRKEKLLSLECIDTTKRFIPKQTNIL